MALLKYWNQRLMKKNNFRSIIRSIGINGGIQIVVLLLFFAAINAAAGESSLYTGELPLIPSTTSPITDSQNVTQTNTQPPTSTKTITTTVTTSPTTTPTDESTATLMVTTTNTQSPTSTTTVTSTETPPTTETCGPPAGWIQYIVQSGDNLYRISLKFSTTIATLQNANCMGTSTVVVVGERIWVPNTPTTTPQPSQTPESSDYHDQSK